MDILALKLIQASFFTSLTVLVILLSIPHIHATKVFLIAVFTNIFLIVIYLFCDHLTGGAGINEAVLFHLKYSINIRIIKIFWQEIALLIVSILITYLVCRSLFLKINSLKKNKPISRHRTTGSLVTMCLVIFSFLINPATHDIKAVFTDHFSPSLSTPVTLQSIIKDAEIKFPEKKHDFILIYAESLEKTFFDDRLFPSLLPKLTKLIQDKGTSFHGIHQAPMTGWTVAGMTASQCGLPLASFKKTKNNVLLSKTNSYLPGVTCIGDILHANDYNLLFIGGADINFGGKKQFYETHGFQQILGKSKIKQTLQNDKLPESKWGVFDDDLAKAALKKKEHLKSPYGMVILTLDTHAPIGHETPSCKDIKYKNGEDDLLNSIKCTDTILSSLITKLLKTSEDAVIFLTSDHLSMAPHKKLNLALDQRENLFVVFNSKYKDSSILSPTISRKATTMDLAPTILESLGVHAPHFTFGRSLYNKSDSTLINAFRLRKVTHSFCFQLLLSIK